MMLQNVFIENVPSASQEYNIIWLTEVSSECYDLAKNNVKAHTHKAIYDHADYFFIDCPLVCLWAIV